MVDGGEQNFKELVGALLINVQPPEPSGLFAMVHQFVCNVTSITISRFGVGQPTPDVVSDPSPLI
jgi:hypothetical protein